MVRWVKTIHISDALDVEDTLTMLQRVTVPPVDTGVVGGFGATRG